jgi:hypothetical protein
MSTFLRILFLAVAIVATTSPAVQAQQQTLPSVDIHVYLDVSGTIFTGQSDGPNFKIVEMLRSLFDAPIEGGRTFTSPNDSIHLNTFGQEVKPFGSAIDGGSKAARDKLLDDFAKSRKPGKDVPPQQAPDQQTRFDSLLDSIRRTIEIRSSGAERLKVIIIASDFVHDASGESKKFCNEVILAVPKNRYR